MGQRAMRGRHPQDFMEELGFGPLDLVDSFSVSMAGEAQTRSDFNLSMRAPALDFGLA